MTGVRWRVVEKLADDLDEQITGSCSAISKGKPASASGRARPPSRTG
jgi:hypothetical protein